MENLLAVILCLLRAVNIEQVWYQRFFMLLTQTKKRHKRSQKCCNIGILIKWTMGNRMASISWLLRAVHKILHSIKRDFRASIFNFSSHAASLSSLVSQLSYLQVRVSFLNWNSQITNLLDIVSCPPSEDGTLHKERSWWKITLKSYEELK